MHLFVIFVDSVQTEANCMQTEAVNNKGTTMPREFDGPWIAFPFVGWVSPSFLSNVWRLLAPVGQEYIREHELEFPCFVFQRLSLYFRSSFAWTINRKVKDQKTRWLWYFGNFQCFVRQYCVFLHKYSVLKLDMEFSF